MRRKLVEGEISSLVETVRAAEHLTYVGPWRWRKMDSPYIAAVDGRFAGVCMVYNFEGWIKLGPLVILDQFRGLGLSRLLVSRIITDYPDQNIFLSSANPIVQHVARELGFQQLTNYWQLPSSCRWWLICQLPQHFSWQFLVEGWCKRSFVRWGQLHYFIKTK